MLVFPNYASGHSEDSKLVDFAVYRKRMGQEQGSKLTVRAWWPTGPVGIDVHWPSQNFGGPDTLNSV